MSVSSTTSMYAEKICAHPLCEAILWPPMLTINCKNNHSFHPQCFQLLTLAHPCPSCDSSFDEVLIDERLERIAQSLHELGQHVLMADAYLSSCQFSPREENALSIRHRITVGFLHQAAELRHFEVLEYLFGRKEVDCLIKERLDLIFAAYKKGDIQLVRCLLKATPCFLENSVCCLLAPLLQDAIERGNRIMADCLLGVQEIPREPKEGVSLMYLACRRRDPSMVEILLRHGISPSENNDLSCLRHENSHWRESKTYHEHEATPLECAAKNSQFALVDLLLAAGAEMDQRGSRGRTALFHAVCASQELMALRLIDRGAAIDILDEEDYSLVSQAILSNLFNVVQKLIQKGVVVYLPHYRREGSCLHDAASIDNQQLLSLLLQNKGKRLLSFQILKKETPLAVAVRAGIAANVRLLLEAGSNPLLKDGEEETVIDQAREYLQQARTYLRVNNGEKAQSMVRFREQILCDLLAAVP